MINAFSCSGGGIRGLAVAGALGQGAALGRWLPGFYDCFTGDSFGALIAALIDSGWKPKAIQNLFIKTDIKKLLTPLPWNMRKAIAPFNPIKLKGVAKFIDSLNLMPSDKLLINVWDTAKNEQVIYCNKRPEWAIKEPIIRTRWFENAYRSHTIGEVITRSMALPGLMADSPRYMDGGLGDHPPLCFLPDDSEVLIINMGYAGLVGTSADGLVTTHEDTIPKTMLDRALYAYEVTAHTRQKYAFDRFKRKFIIRPKVYHIGSTDFKMSKEDRLKLIKHGYEHSYLDWQHYPVPA